MGFFWNKKKEKKNNKKQPERTRLTPEELFSKTINLYPKACSELDKLAVKPFDEGIMFTLKFVISEYNGSLSSDEWYDLANVVDKYIANCDNDSLKSSFCKISTSITEESINASNEERRKKEEQLASKRVESKEETLRETKRMKRSLVPTEKVIAETTQAFLPRLFDGNMLDREFGDEYLNFLTQYANGKGIDDESIDWDCVSNYSTQQSSRNRELLDVSTRWLAVTTGANLRRSEQNVRKLQEANDQFTQVFLNRHPVVTYDRSSHMDLPSDKELQDMFEDVSKPSPKATDVNKK